MNAIQKAKFLMSMVYSMREHVKHMAIKIRKGRSYRKYGAPQTGTLLRVCPGGNHAWFRTPVGIIRKPHYT